MCLATPALVIDRDGDFARVDFGGVRRRVCVALTPTAAPGQYVLVHAGMAIETIDEQEALRTLELIRDVYSDSAPPDAMEGQPDLG